MALSPDAKELLSFFEQNWYLHSAIPSEDKAAAHGYTNTLYRSSIANKEFLEALERRGIATHDLRKQRSFSAVNAAPILNDGDSDALTTRPGVAPPTIRGQLTPEQVTAINVVLDFRDTRSQKKKLQELSISSTKWNGWLRDPVFNDYITRYSEYMLQENLFESHSALLDRVRSGDIGAIKYYNEIVGRYTQAKNEKIDVAAILMRVLEIIQVHVTDSAALGAIARDFAILADANDIKTHSHVPELAPVEKTSVGVMILEHDPGGF